MNLNLGRLILSIAFMLASFCLGKQGYSVIWSVFPIFANILLSLVWKITKRHEIDLEQASHQNKDDVLVDLLYLPSWVHFPDQERVEWLNKV